MSFDVLNVLAAIGILGLILIIWGLTEAACVKVTRDSIVIGCKEGNSSPDLRILYFSDLHREFCMVPASRLCALIRAENAAGGLDAVIFGGDIVNGHKSVLPGLKYIETVSAVCGELHIPFMAVTGNHDAFAPADEIGCFPFDNMNRCIKYLRSRRDGRYIAFAGIPDSGRKDRVWTIPPAPSAGIDYKSYILLSHNPDVVLHLPEGLPMSIDAIISGHIHGGQIRTPMGLEFRMRHDELPHQGIISGLHDINGIKVFISKGIGCVFVPFRFFCRPEINILEIFAE